jgi:hypothetical protein
VYKIKKLKSGQGYRAKIIIKKEVKMNSSLSLTNYALCHEGVLRSGRTALAWHLNRSGRRAKEKIRLPLTEIKPRFLGQGEGEGDDC